MKLLNFFLIGIFFVVFITGVYSEDILIDLNDSEELVTDNYTSSNLTDEDCDFIINYQNSFLDKCQVDIIRLKKVILSYQIFTGVLTFIYGIYIIRKIRRKDGIKT